MINLFDPLRELDCFTMVLRLVIAMFFGCFVGLERERKKLPAGMRTYMLVCIGACLTVILSQYEQNMIHSLWKDVVDSSGDNLKIDMSRFAAQVINGIGFLGAGTIIVSGRQEVKGLTTAAGLWASACIGIAIGAGLYECVITGFVLIIISNILLPYISDMVVEKAKNMNVYVELSNLRDIRKLVIYIKSLDIEIYEVDMEKSYLKKGNYPNAVLLLNLKSRRSHEEVLSLIAERKCVRLVDEI